MSVISDLEIKALPRPEAAKKVAELAAQAHEAVLLACKIATEHKLTFDFGVAYGMGGTFTGDPADSEYGRAGWHPSSHSC